MKTLVVSCLVLVLSLNCSAAMISGYLEHYTQDDGLAANDVSFICIDDSSTKWFAEHKSDVSRFDEDFWETYAASVWSMALDYTGRTWITTLHSLCYLEGPTFRAVDYPLFSAFGSVATGPDGALWTGGWIGYSEVWRTFDLVDLEVWTTWKDVDLPWAFAFDGENRAWFVGCSGGVYRLSARGEAWDRIDDNLRLPSRGIRYYDIHASQTGRVWVQGYAEEDYSTLRPLYSNDYETWLPFDECPFPSQSASLDCDLQIKCVTVDAIWVSTHVYPGYRMGAFYYDCSHWRFIRVGSLVQVIEVDQRTGDVWFGTDGAGVAVQRGGPDAWPPVWIELEAGTGEARGSEAMLLKGSAEFQMELSLDFYVAVQLPDGTLLYAPDWTPSMTPYASGVDVPIGLTLEDYRIIELDVTAMPSGTYRFYSAFMHAGTMDFASNIASCEWEFNR